MVDKKKVANNMLEFLLDPTVIPVEKRLYIGPFERMQNEFYTDAKADAARAYGDQKHNSDFYPSRNRQQSQREASVMDRKTLIASLDIIAQNFADGDPIATDLRTMAYAIDKMGDEGLQSRLAAKTFPCPDCGTKVLEQTSYCVKCKKKVKPGTSKKADQNDPRFMYTGSPAPDETPEAVETKEASDLGKWSKKASDLVRRTLLAEVITDIEEKKDEQHDEPKLATEESVVPAPEEKPSPEEKPATEEKKPVEAAAPVVPVPEEDKPEEEDKTEEKPVEANVDTSILGCDMSMPIMTAEDVGVLSSDEQSRLNSIMTGGFDLSADQKEKVGL